MKKHTNRSLIVLAGLAVAATAGVTQAALVRVTIAGTVESNSIRGSHVGVTAGDPVSVAFNVNSNAFVNSVNYPTRGYALDLSTFAMTVGPATVAIANPQPNGQAAYFVLRDNDPAVDGFFLSPGVEVDAAIGATVPGTTGTYGLSFSRSFNDGTPLPSLNILDALGTYGRENLGSFGFTLGRNGGGFGTYSYQSITLAAVPEPTAAAALAAAGAAMLAGRRRHRA